MNLINHLRSGFPGLGQTFRSDLGNRLVQLLEFAFSSFRCQLFPEDADLLAILYTLDQTLEADATAWTGINTVCIACRPSAETRVTQRIGGPAINCPT